SAVVCILYVHLPLSYCMSLCTLCLSCCRPLVFLLFPYTTLFRSVYFQPISYFGVYPPDKIRRITIPDVIRRVAAQCPDVSEQDRSEEHTSELQSRFDLVCRLLLEKKKIK